MFLHSCDGCSSHEPVLNLAQSIIEMVNGVLMSHQPGPALPPSPSDYIGNYTNKEGVSIFSGGSSKCPLACLQKACISYYRDPCLPNAPCWVGWSLVVQVIGFSLNPLRRRSGSKGRPVAISVSWALIAQLAEH